jgi:hypothetical protein
MQENIMSEQNPKNTFSEQMEVQGNQLVERFKEIIEQGNVRRLIVRDQDGKTLVEIPLTAGALIGGAALFLSPWLAALGAIGALVARLNIEVVREEPEATITDVKEKIDDAADRLSGQ